MENMDPSFLVQLAENSPLVFMFLVFVWSSHRVNSSVQALVKEAIESNTKTEAAVSALTKAVDLLRETLTHRPHQ